MNLRSRRVTHAFEAPLYLLVALCQGLTLLFLNSDACESNALARLFDDAVRGVEFPETCALSTGGNLVVSSMVFFLLAGLTSFLANKAEKDEEAYGDGLREPLTV